MASGATQFKTDFQDPGSAVLNDPGYYGGAYTGDADADESTDRYVRINSNGDLEILLNSLGGVAETATESYTLQHNINMFTAGYLTPLGITNLQQSILPNDARQQTTLRLEFEFYPDDYTDVDLQDTFLVRVRDINSYARLLNVSRILRALMFNKRDNSRITGMILLAMLRNDGYDANDGTHFQDGNLPLSGDTYEGFDFTAKVEPLSADVQIVDHSNWYGPVIPSSTSSTNPIVAFAWPSDIYDAISANEEDVKDWLIEITNERIAFFFGGVNLTQFSWITAVADADTPYVGFEFRIDDDPVKAQFAIAVVDVLRAGAFRMADFVRGIRRTLPASDDDTTIHRGVAAHLHDTDKAKAHDMQKFLWLERGW